MRYSKYSCSKSCQAWARSYSHLSASVIRQRRDRLSARGSSSEGHAHQDFQLMAQVVDGGQVILQTAAPVDVTLSGTSVRCRLALTTVDNGANDTPAQAGERPTRFRAALRGHQLTRITESRTDASGVQRIGLRLQGRTPDRLHRARRDTVPQRGARAFQHRRQGPHGRSRSQRREVTSAARGSGHDSESCGAAAEPRARATREPRPWEVGGRAGTSTTQSTHRRTKA